MTDIRVWRKGDQARLRRPWGNLPAGAEVYLQADPAKSGSVPVDPEKDSGKDPVELVYINIDMLEPFGTP